MSEEPGNNGSPVVSSACRSSHYRHFQLVVGCIQCMLVVGCIQCMLVVGCMLAYHQVKAILNLERTGHTKFPRRGEASVTLYTGTENKAKAWDTIWCISCHAHHITSHRITSHHITSHHITSHHITSHHITSHHITSHHITSHHITSHHITAQHSVARRNTMQCSTCADKGVYATPSRSGQAETQSCHPKMACAQVWQESTMRQPAAQTSTGQPYWGLVNGPPGCW